MLRATDGSSVALITLFISLKPAGRVPPDAILLSGNKSMQKCLLLAEGISFAGFLWLLITAVTGIRPCVIGPDLSL